MNDKKIAFIICVNNEIFFEECKYYINRLCIPSEYEIDVLAISEATSMCAAYNLGMQSTDAKYKIYMHQDVFIRNENFLKEILNIFQGDKSVGMIGVLGGTEMPETGVAYRAWNVGTVDCRDPGVAYYTVFQPEIRQDMYVEAVDGLLIATQYDVPWREDLFQHFDFYDISQSFEMRNAGYRIMVPYQEVPWVIHDSNFVKLKNYDEGRQICLREYPEFFCGMHGYEFFYNEEWNQLSASLAAELKHMVELGAWNQVKEVIEAYRAKQVKDSELEVLGIMSDIYTKEQKKGVCKGFFDECNNWQEIYNRYMNVRFLLRRMELEMPEEEYNKLILEIKNETVSPEAIIELLIHSVVDKKTCLQRLIECYKKFGQALNAQQAELLYQKVKDKPISIAYTKSRNS